MVRKDAWNDFNFFELPRQMLTSMKGEINNNTIIVGDFNTPVTPTDRSTKQKINMETQTLNDATDELNLIDIFRTFHSKTMNFSFFSSAHGKFSSIDHILGYKSILGKFKKIEIISRIFSDCNGMIKCQLQGKNYSKYKHMEAKQQTSE